MLEDWEHLEFDYSSNFELYISHGRLIDGEEEEEREITNGTRMMQVERTTIMEVKWS